MRKQKTAAAFAWARRELDQRAAAIILTARYIPVGRIAVNMTAGATGFPHPAIAVQSVGRRGRARIASRRLRPPDRSGFELAVVDGEPVLRAHANQDRPVVERLLRERVRLVEGQVAASEPTNVVDGG